MKSPWLCLWGIFILKKYIKSKFSIKIQELKDNETEVHKKYSQGNIYFKATTTYPGLLLSYSNDEEVSIDEQIIQGLSFDITSGLPIIKSQILEQLFKDMLQSSRYREHLKHEIKDDSVLLLLDNYKEKSVDYIFNKKDIIFDAKIVSSGKVFDDDFYLSRNNKYLESIPIQTLKIKDNVTFQFNFNFTDGIISKEQKRNLCMQILIDIGVGAKTNVGYGQFKDFKYIE